MNCTGISYAIKKLNLPLFICTKDFHTPHNKSSLVVVVRESPTDLRDDNVLLSNNTHFLLVYYHHFGDCCSFCKPLFINCCCCRPSMKCRTFSIPHSHTTLWGTIRTDNDPEESTRNFFSHSWLPFSNSCHPQTGPVSMYKVY